MNNSQFLSISKQVFLHISFWTITSLFFMNFSLLRPLCTSNMRVEIICVLMIASVCYINQLVLYPRYFKKKQVKYWSSSLFLIILISISEILFFENMSDISFFFAYEKNIVFFTFLIIISLRNAGFLLFSLLLRHYQEIKNNLNAEILMLKKEITWYAEKIEVEKSVVRSTVAIHFLNNIITCLTASALQKKDNLPYLLRKLAVVLNYYMDKASQESVEISDELSFCRNFIELETYRYEEKIKSNFHNTEEPETMKIAPLLFESFIENAFKYAPRDGSGYVKIKFDFSKTNQILFTCVNNKRKNSDQNVVSTKSGIKTILNRLNLLYEDSHSFQIQEDDELFQVTLSLDLTTSNKLKQSLLSSTKLNLSSFDHSDTCFIKYIGCSLK